MTTSVITDHGGITHVVVTSIFYGRPIALCEYARISGLSGLIDSRHLTWPSVAVFDGDPDCMACIALETGE